MALKHILATAVLAAGSVVEGAKYVDQQSGVSYAEYVTAQNIAYRIAIPSNTTAPFDILLQIVAPVSTTGWAGLSWGGQMTYSPLTVAWANGNSTVVSSRVATAHSQPSAYGGATYVQLPTSTTNSTHWRLDVLCKGCSQWTDSSGNKAALDPTSTSVKLAYAMCSTAPATPSSNMSTFTHHNNKGTFQFDLSSAKLANFTAVVQNLS